MIIEDEIEITISNQGAYWRSLGYGECKQGTKITVSICDLPENSNKKVRCECDSDMCSETFERSYQLIMRKSKLYGKKTFCKACSRSLITELRDTSGISLGNTKRIGPNHPRWKENKEDFAAYAYKVRRKTEKVYEKFEDVINPNKYPRRVCGVSGGYQLDHKRSIKECFERGICIDDASSIENLQMLPWKQNRIKSGKEI